LPDDHPSRMAFQVCVDHPEYVVTPTGRSRQSPEIVCRTNDEAHAKRVFHTYAKVLGGAAPDSFAPVADTREDAKRLASLEREVDQLRAVVAGLADAKKK